MKLSLWKAGHAAVIEQIAGENTAAVVFALAFDMHTFPKCPFFHSFYM